MAAAQGDWEKLLEDRVREVSRGWVILSLTGRGENWDLLSVQWESTEGGYASEWDHIFTLSQSLWLWFRGGSWSSERKRNQLGDYVVDSCKTC